jgi:hypothetical protein
LLGSARWKAAGQTRLPTFLMKSSLPIPSIKILGSICHHRSLTGSMEMIKRSIVRAKQPLNLSYCFNS